MTSASAAARVNVRDVLRVKAVESYVRNFAGEAHRLQELLEVTLSYGVFCISRNFQLKGMSVDELRAVTKHDQTKSQDFYVRNAAKPRRSDLAGAADPQPLFVKAPHFWRDGDSKLGSTDTYVSDAPVTSAGNVASEPEVFFLPNEAHKDKLDEIDFYTRVLGKTFVDTAWATYSSRGSAYLTSDQLQACLTRVDQRKRPDLIPPTDLPVCSFVEFLNAYVKASVAKISTLVEPAQETEQPESALESDSITGASGFTPRSRPTKIHAGRDLETDHQARRTPTSKPRTPVTPINARDGVRAAAGARSLQTVQSKIKPELRAHKEKLLRVKKNQTQLMNESLARARLAEYAAKHHDNQAAKSPLPIKRMPLDKITPGAAALEIVDGFIRSPLMDKFSADTQQQQQPRNAPRDSLKEELYGTAAHDDSFLGCKVPPPQPKPTRRDSQTKPPRDYRGWLGDFGPQHTKTVRPAWETDATTGGNSFHGDDSSEGENEHKSNRRSATSSGQRDRFEWKFDMLAGPHGASTKVSSSQRRTRDLTPTKSLHGDDENDDDDSLSVSDAWSARSDASDPVYRWLKTTVQ